MFNVWPVRRTHKESPFALSRPRLLSGRIEGPLRDAAVATLALIALIAIGSGGFATLDPALLGYAGATVVAAFGVTWRVSAFWRRPASAFYARALLAGLRRPRSLARTVEFAGRDLVAQGFIRKRSLARWAAHMLLSLGTLASFAITVPLVFGWMLFEPVGDASYRIIVFTLPTIAFAVDGVFAWLLFHGLSIAAVAVVLGAGYFLAVRVRSHAGQGANSPRAVSGFAVAPLLLLLVVGLSGLALPASRGWPAAFQLAAVLHEVSVVVLLVALPFSKLAHVLIRPLQLGARAVRAGAAVQRYCGDCGTRLAPDEQQRAVTDLLARRGFSFGAHLDRCQPCRRRRIATVQAALVGAQFQPRLPGRRRASIAPSSAPLATSAEVS
jgi:hypothetical protein